jgi:hypothetical protein
MEGASDVAIRLMASGRLPSRLMLAMSSSWKLPWVFLEKWRRLLPSTRVANMPVVLPLEGSARWIPESATRSPGLHWSTRSPSSSTSIERGSWPGGARSGISWSEIIWWSMYSDMPYSTCSGLPFWSFVGIAEPVAGPFRLVLSR